MEKIQLTAKEVFIAWKTGCQVDVGKARYTASERLEQLDMLCEDFMDNGIDYEEAKTFKKDFVDFVVTKEGMKGNGQYKGWKEQAAENFDGLLIRWYNGEFKKAETVVTTRERRPNDYGKGDYMVRMPIIVAWSKQRFGMNWTESLCLEAHKICSSLNNMFLEEVIEANWSKTGENVPKWIEDYCV